MILNGGSVEVEKEIFVVVRQGKLFINKSTFESNEYKEITLEPEMPAYENYLGKKISLIPVNNSERKLFVNSSKKPFKNIIDYDRINSNVVIRTRRSGDCINLAGRNATKSLKKLFNEEKLLPVLRNNAVVIASGDEVIYVEGFGCSDSVKVTDRTKNAVEIKIEKE